MATTEQAVESRSTGRHRRKTPEEIEGFQSVVLRPGGQVDLLNISNRWMFVQTETHTKPGSAVRVCIVTTGVTYEVQAKTVRSEITTADGSGLHYQVAIAFDEPLDLIDDSDVAPVDAPVPSGPQLQMDLFPPNEASIDLQVARTPNRW